MKSVLGMAALMAVAADAALVARAPASSKAAGPYTIKDKAAAIASVMSVMSSNKPKTTGAATAKPVKVTGAPLKTSTTSKGKSPTTTSPTKKASSKIVPPIKTTPVAKLPSSVSKKAATTSKAKLKRAVNKVDNYGACGVGSPITSTLDCYNGWACSSWNPYYYQCLAATSSSSTTTTTTTTAQATTTTTSRAAVTTTTTAAVTTPTTTAITTTTTTTTAPAVVNPPAVNGGAAQVTTTTTTTTTRATTTLQTTTSTTPALGVNDACGPQPNFGYNYKPAATLPAGWMADSVFNAASLAGSAPSGYTWTFQGLYASLNQGGYLGVTQLSSYSPATCSAMCSDSSVVPGCRGFVIYYERTPSVAPAAACPSPDAQTVVKCTFYNAAVDYTLATNIGEWRSNFAVVISGANGYSKA